MKIGDSYFPRISYIGEIAQCRECQLIFHQYLRLAAALAYSISSLGCASITVMQGNVEVKRYWGIVMLNAAPDSDGIVYFRNSGFGITISNSEATIGYVDQLQLRFYDTTKCRVIVLIRNDVQASELRTLMNHPALEKKLCLMDEGVKK